MGASKSRTIRVATVTLGPIIVESGILGAVEDDDPGLVSVCTHGEKDKRPPSLIKRRDYCPTCDNDDKPSFRKGKVLGSGVVLIDPTALAALAAADEAAKKTITLTTHPAAELGGAFPTGKSYYLAARPGAANQYALLAQLMSKRPDLAFVGEFSFGGPAMLYQVLVCDGVLTMRQLARPELVRERPEVAGEANEQWLNLAEQFAETICTKWDPEHYRGKRTEALAKVLEAATPVPLSGEGPAAVAAPTVDLGTALAAALAAAMPPAAPPAPPAPPRKRASRKPVVKAEPLAS